MKDQITLKVSQSRQLLSFKMAVQSIDWASFFVQEIIWLASSFDILLLWWQDGRRISCCCCCCCSSWDDTTMRWFRKNEDNAPRLISLSPLRQLDSSAAAADAEVASVGWGYQQSANYSSGRLNGEDRPPHLHRRSRSALSDNLPTDRSSYSEHHHHLPCTLKRKPAVRRRSGGKGIFREKNLEFFKEISR